MPGCFLNNSSNDTVEVNSLIGALNAYSSLSNIPFAMVGSEAVSLQGVTVDQLITRIKQVRNATGGQIPIATAEYWQTWLNQPQLADAVDHSHRVVAMASFRQPDSADRIAVFR